MKDSKRHRIAVLTIAAVLLAGCATPSESPTVPPTQAATQTPSEETPSPTRTKEGPITIAFVPKLMDIGYFDSANEGAQEAATKLGIRVLYRGPWNTDVSEQIELVKSLIARGVDGLAIAANDYDALESVGRYAIAQGIPVVSWDASIAHDGRIIDVQVLSVEGLARVQLEIASRLAGGQGQIAILRAGFASSMPHGSWIHRIRRILEEDEAFQGLELLDTGYGDYEDEKSYSEALGLMADHPDLEVIIAPMSVVGLADVARAIQDQGEIGQVFVTGLGVPNQMREYVKSGAIPEFVLWNPIDLGYLTVYATYRLVMGDITGEPGDTFDAGRLGSYTISDDGAVVLDPYIFNADNIDDFDF